MRCERPRFLTERRGRDGGLLLCLVVSLSLACAQVQGPSGGPVDDVPPHLVAVSPESAAVALGEVREVRVTFSEKMDPVDAWRFLYLYPEVEYAHTGWSGRREARITLAGPLPPDTVIVAEIVPGIRDAHNVASTEYRSWPWATADSLPVGELSGQLLQEKKPPLRALVELYAVPPETLRYFQQPLLRRAPTDSQGAWRLRWLPVPGGPWLLRAFADLNGNLRPDDNEPQRLLPDTLRLSAGSPRRNLGLFVIYAPSTPGSLRTVMAEPPTWPGPVYGWPERIAVEDTGWVARPQRTAPPGLQRVGLGEPTTWAGVGPGLVRMLFFVDVDGDSLLSVLPAAEGSDGEGFLEPHAEADSLDVAPGLESTFAMPAFPDTLEPWHGEPEAR
jgi:hypothetical protein